MVTAIIKQISVGPMANYAYLIGNDETSTCAAVDPSWDAMAIQSAATEAGWKIEKILLTHTHFDHANALEDLASATDAEVFVHNAERNEIPEKLKTHGTEDGSKIEIGNLSIKCLHTPGHTPGSQCFLVDNSLISGDTLFIGGCGRVDLPGSNPGEMLESLKKLAELDPKTIVYPGHDYGSSSTSTIGEQLEQNPYLKAKSETMLL